jgi:YgiT-type zinc finger domain-containing protein
MDQCPLCGGKKSEGSTTFTADLGFGVVVVRNVPALVCDQCGEDWINDETMISLESIVEDAKENQSELEMVPYRKAAS